MVDVILFSKQTTDFLWMKPIVKAVMEDQEYSLENFNYVMDMMDYVYSASPEKLIVIYCEENAQSGLEVARKLYDLNKRGRFCLCSSRQPENLEDFFFSGFSYFIPPQTDDAFERCMRHFSEFYDETRNRALSLKNQSGVQSIPLYKIEYVMSDKRKIIVNEKGARYEFYYKLDEIEDMTQGLFLRCHQSYLVNMQKIKEFVDDGLLLLSGEFIPVSRKKYFQAKRSYLSFVAGSSDIITG